MEKIKVNFEKKIIKISSDITVKELLTILNSIDLLNFTIIGFSNTDEVLNCINSENENIKMLKHLGNLTNREIAIKLNINERTFYRRLKLLGLN